MGDISGSSIRKPSTNDSESSNKRRSGRLSRLFKRGNSKPEDGKGEGQPENSAQNDTQRRRQQVYQAQRRHRNRKAEYVQSLEAELARLQHMDAVINSEKNELAHQNRLIKQYVASQSLDVHLDALNFSSSSGSGSAAGEDLSMLGSAGIDIRFDPVTQHERTFLDIEDTAEMGRNSQPSDFQPLSETSSQIDAELPSNGPPSSRQNKRKPVKGDSWAALDFILALEWPCKDHVGHHSINPNADAGSVCHVGPVHGHALTATAAVYQSAQPPSGNHEFDHSHASRPGLHRRQNVTAQQRLHPGTPKNWQLPHSEIDKLVALSEHLELDNEQLTPAQAYSAVRETVPADGFLAPVLEELKARLGRLVRCIHFGAVIDADIFWQHLNTVIKNLMSTRPELAQGGPPRRDLPVAIRETTVGHDKPRSGS